MKHGKNPTVKQSKIIQANKLNSDNWLVSKVYPDKLELVHRHTGCTRIAYKQQRGVNL